MGIVLKILSLFCVLAVISCAKEEEELEPSDDHCVFNMSVTYSLGVNASSDFIAQNTSGTGSVVDSTCPSLQAGYVNVSPKRYITKVHNTITFSLQVGAFDDTIFDFEILNGSITPRELTHCENSYRTIETIKSGTLNTTNNTIAFLVEYKIDKDACFADGMDPSGYLHTEIKGIWEEPCNSGIKHWVGYYGNGEVDTVEYYSTGACTGRRMYIEMNGPTTIGNESSYPKSKTTSFQNFLVNLNDSALVTSFNNLAMCGITNWTTGIDFNVKGRFCDFAANGIRSSVTFPSSELKDFDIFSKSGSILNFGDRLTGDGSSLLNRPISIDTAKDYNFNNSFVVVPVWLD